MSQQPGSNDQNPPGGNDNKLPSIREVLPDYPFPSQTNVPHSADTSTRRPGPEINIISEDPRYPPPPRNPAPRTGTIQCPDCPFVTDRPSTLDVHRRRHTDETPYQCTICLKRFKTISNLNRHIKTHGYDGGFEPANDGGSSNTGFPGKGGTIIRFP